MSDSYAVDLPDEAATLRLGQQLATVSGLIFLRGELGAGKTTFVRGYLRALGYEGAVKSPTYTLIEPYDLNNRILLHLDIYRLGDPSELEHIGVIDELEQGNTLLVEWPERAHGLLGKPDLDIALYYQDDARRAELTPATSELASKLAQVISEINYSNK